MALAIDEVFCATEATEATEAARWRMNLSLKREDLAWKKQAEVYISSINTVLAEFAHGACEASDVF
jgi:hypothetical protein